MNKNFTTPGSPKTESRLTQMITMGKSILHHQHACHMTIAILTTKISGNEIIKLKTVHFKNKETMILVTIVRKFY